MSNLPRGFNDPEPMGERESRDAIREMREGWKCYSQGELIRLLRIELEDECIIVPDFVLSARKLPRLFKREF
ncbi:hypothetical protein PQQ81_02630 [Paraburkholderia strydomiana]|uniref:hypothetical protein n=1 Tax=Paraburkholderia strydomiana TaxID=1245417 RepID=UPI0038BD50B6